MHYTIYQITNLINGKIYIGAHKTNNLEDGYMGSGKHLKRAQDKYGIENFAKEYLGIYRTQEEMFNMESKLVNREFVEREDTYNINTGGFGGFDYINQNKINSYEKLSEYGKRGNISLLKHLKEDVKFAKEVSEKRSKTQKERYASGKIIVSEKFKSAWVGKKHKEETKEKMREKRRKYFEFHHSPTKNKKWICKEGINKAVYLEEVEEFIKEGWEEGRNITYLSKGKILINLQGEEKFIEKEELSDFISKGWKRGRINNTNKGTHSSLNKIVVSNKITGNCKFINIEEKNQYLEEGWERGNYKAQGRNKGNCWIHNMKENKFIPEIELDFYIKQGWVKGIYRNPLIERKVWFSNIEFKKNIRISLSETDKKKEEGWVKGRISFK